MSHHIRSRFFMLCISVLLGYSATAYATEPTINSQYQLISTRHISKTLFEYTLKATFDNGDTPIKQVKATVVSHSATTKVIEGELSFNDLEAGESTKSNDTFIIQQDLLENLDNQYPGLKNLNLQSLSWDVSYLSAREIGGIVNITVNDMEMREGKRKSLKIDYRFSRKDEPKNETFTLRLSQIVEPSEGLVFETSIDNTGLVDKNGNGIINTDTKQVFTAVSPGEYTITTTATVVETGKAIEAVTKVKVYGADELYLGLRLSILENKIPVDSNTPLVGVDIWGDDSKLVTEVMLKQLETGETRILPLNQDKTRYDFEYSDILAIDTSQADRCFNFIAIAVTNKGTQESNPDKICVTQFPIQFQGPEPEHLWISPKTGASIANNYLIITVEEDTTEERIKEIAQAINGRVVGQGLYRAEYQIELLDQPVADSATVFKGMLNTYSSLLKELGFTEVKSIELYSRTGYTLSISDDPFYVNGDQNYLDLIRANEAWYTGGAKEAPTIAIVDTGVDFDHPDIRTKLLLGKTFFPDATLTDDSHSHGTHVTGIAAAITNNGLGIAGVSRNSYILPVRVSPVREVFYKDMADGIEWAAQQKAKIINVSIGVPENLTEEEIRTCIEQFGDRGENVCVEEKAKLALCGAIDFASVAGSLVVVAAGNDGIDRRNYPALCSGAIAVGATDDSGDARWAHSQFGDWITVAASGEDVLSLTNLDLSFWDTNVVCSPTFTGDFGDYGCKSGTSQAAPQVSGALAQILARHPEWISKNVKEIRNAIGRLEDSAKALPGENLGKGRIDVFEAVFNGDFEVTDIGAKTNLAEWKIDQEETEVGASEECSDTQQFHNIFPVSGERMLICSSGNLHGQADSLPHKRSAGVNNILNIPAGVSKMPVSFKLNVITEEFKPDYVINGQAQWNDRLVVELVHEASQSKHLLLDIGINDLIGFGYKDIEGEINGNIFKQSGWLVFSDANVPVQEGRYILRIRVKDDWPFDRANDMDFLGDTLVLIDQVKFLVN